MNFAVIMIERFLNQENDLGKDLFYRTHNPSHLTLYPDVLKLKTIVVSDFFFQKCHLFIIYKSISGYSMAWTFWQWGVDYGFVFNKQMAFLKKKIHNNYCFYIQNIWIQCRM